MVVKASALLSKAKIVCIKVGSSLLLDTEQGTLRYNWINALAQDIAAMQSDGKKVILISSGAVAAARNNPIQDGETLVKKQALAAVGQPRLMMAYAPAFAKCNIDIAQILINPADTEDRRRHLNVRGTIEELIKNSVVPIINENDSVSSEALKYGDNDRLSARVASMVNADILLMLSDVDGLYSAPPAKNSDAKHIPWLNQITQETFTLAGGSSSRHGTGGMRTKLSAAQMCLNSNCHMILGSGKAINAVSMLQKGAKSTVFEAEGTPVQARKRWLSSIIVPSGTVIIDDGAKKALIADKSLLAAGVVSSSGDFLRGDAVALIDKNGLVLGHGLINYSEAELKLIKGCKSQDIREILGFIRDKTLIHRDNFMLKD